MMARIQWISGRMRPLPWFASAWGSQFDSLVGWRFRRFGRRWTKCSAICGAVGPWQASLMGSPSNPEATHPLGVCFPTNSNAESRSWGCEFMLGENCRGGQRLRVLFWKLGETTLGEAVSLWVSLVEVFRIKSFVLHWKHPHGVKLYAHYLGGGFKYFLFSPRTLGKWSQFD